MSRVVIVLVCSILVTMSLTNIFLHENIIEDDSVDFFSSAGKSNNATSSPNISSFNGTIPYPLNTVYLDIDTFPDMSFGAHLQPVVQDFFQLKNGSYMVLITTEASGTFTNGEPYYDGSNALIMLNQDGDMVNAKGYSNYAGDSWSSMQLYAGEFFHVYGAHTMINLDEEYIILAGTTGYQLSQYTSIGGVINSSTWGEHIFVAKVNLSTFEIDSYTIFYTVGGNSNRFCKVAVFEESFVNSTAFKIVVSSYVPSTNPNCISISIGGTSHSATSIISTNILVTMDHNLSVMNSIEVPSGDQAQSTPILLENGYAVLREYWGGADDKLRILAPGSNSWSTVNTNCEEIRYIVALNNESIFFLCGYLAGSIPGSSPLYPVYFHAYNTTSGTMAGQHIGYADAPNAFIFKSGYITIDNNRILATFTQMSFTTLTSIRFYESTTIEVNLTSNVSTIFQQGYFPFTSGYADSAVRSHPDGFVLYRSMVRGESSLMILKGEPNAAKYQNLKILEIDTDIDGYADRVDAFPFERSQWSDADGDGYGDNPIGILADDCPNQAGNSTIDFIGCVDTDGDGQSNQGDQYPIDATQISDIDSDGYGDNISGVRGDSCPNQYGESNRNGTFGCQDTDFDGWADSQDEFPTESSQWIDSDGDGFGDQYNGFEGDTCPTIFGTSTQDTFGCPDTDGDEWSDNGEDLPHESSQWQDLDGDGYGDNQSIGALLIDWFPNDGTQWNDTDGDEHGDNPFGNSPDRFPLDSTRWKDSDLDGYADEDDAFVNDATQWNDTDGDGFGDNPDGYEADDFIDDETEWLDTDGDGLGNNADDFPFDPTQKVDSDGDGMGDNPMGIGADKFPNDPSQWGDIDGDGYGDNATGNNSDAFITDPTQWSDADGDGYGDNPAGRLADEFPQNPTQWEDADGDGLGDNLSGTDADPYLNDFDNDGYNDSIDPLPKLASPGDLDNDGCPDANDSFPDNARECKDSDGDGIGDVEDPDDDNDGWADTDEARMGTDSFSAADVPVEGFEVVFPIPGGGAIGLGAWDLIGMFGGVPLFTWLAFCFVTRGGRSSRFEELLKEAPSREALAAIARSYELSLMLRLIGPHQGIRLERMRAELDDSLESRLAATLAYGDGSASGTASGASVGKTRDGDIGASIAGEVSLMPQQPDISEVGVISSDGYEWIKRHDGASWYRVPNRGLAWSWWND